MTDGRPGQKTACGVVSLRRHCPDQVPGGRRSASELSPASQPFLPAPGLPRHSVRSSSLDHLADDVHVAWRQGRAPRAESPACAGQTSGARVTAVTCGLVSIRRRVMRRGESGCGLLAVCAISSPAALRTASSEWCTEPGVRPRWAGARLGGASEIGGAAACEAEALSAARSPSASDRRGRAARTSAALGRPSAPPQRPRPPRGPAGRHGWHRCQRWSG